MKKILYLALLIGAVSCKAPDNAEVRNWGESSSKSVDHEDKSRITVKESTVINGYRYNIIAIDGKEYLCVHETGIIFLRDER